MKTGRTHFSKNSGDQSFQDISVRLLSDKQICPRYPEKNFHENLSSQFSGNVRQSKNHLFVDIMKTKRKPVMKTVLKIARKQFQTFCENHFFISNLVFL